MSKSSTLVAVADLPASSNFPVKLHYILADLEKDGKENVLGWQPHGRCFAIRDKIRIVKEILPFWFNSSTFESFRRQLNLYSFRRITKGRDRGCYYHEYFIRGDIKLAAQINRVKVNGKVYRKKRIPTLEPDFYSFPLHNCGPSGNSQLVNPAAAVLQSQERQLQAVGNNLFNFALMQRNEIAPQLQNFALHNFGRDSGNQPFLLDPQELSLRSFLQASVTPSQPFFQNAGPCSQICFHSATATSMQADHRYGQIQRYFES